jgi:pimeloyl-ACP methyl ester carboxylesterase
MGSESNFLRTNLPPLNAPPLNAPPSGQAALPPIQLPTLRHGAADLPGGTRLTLRQNTIGKGLPRALLLHGFPEAAFVWDDILHQLDGIVQATAPNLRGFADSSSPGDAKAYRARHPVGDLAALIEQRGAPLDLLVAHDWGGALAWNLAAQRPDLIKRLLIINAPHPAAFLRELLTNPHQQAASDYMNFLCRPDAEALLAEDDFRRLWPFFGQMGAEDPATPGGAWLTEDLRERYRQVWRAGLTGGLNYYRASPLKPPTGPDSPIHRVVFAPEDVTVNVPTTVLWGLADKALPPGLLEGLAQWVPQLHLITVPQASHWIVHEQPQRVAELIAELAQQA